MSTKETAPALSGSQAGSEMATERFQTLSERELAELLTEKDRKNKQKATKGSRLLFDHS